MSGMASRGPHPAKRTTASKASTVVALRGTWEAWEGGRAINYWLSCAGEAHFTHPNPDPDPNLGLEGDSVQYPSHCDDHRN